MSTVAASADLSRAATGATRWRVLVGAILVQLILGTVYGYSIFWKPLESQVFSPVVARSSAAASTVARGAVPVVYVADEAAAKRRHDAQSGALKYAFSLCILSFALTMIAAGRVQDRKGPRFTALIGAGLMGAGFLLAGLALQFPFQGAAGDMVEVALLCATIGLIAGAGIGFAYVCPIAALIKWFPEAKGLVSGIAVAGFGLGAYIISQKDWAIGGVGFIERHGIAAFFLTHGLVSLVAISVGALMLSNPPGTPSRAAAESEWRDTLRQPAFYMLWAMFFSGSLAGLTVIGIVKDFAGEQLVNAQVAAGAALSDPDRAALLLKGAAAVGWLSIFNAIGRVAWGFVSDKVGRTAAFVAMFAFQAVMMFVLAGMHTEMTIAVAASLVGFNFGGNFALFPSATADFFGARNLGANYGLVFTSYGIAGVVGVAAGNMARAMTGSYAAAFALAGGLCLLSAACAVALQVSRKKALPNAA